MGRITGRASLSAKNRCAASMTIWPDSWWTGGIPGSSNIALILAVIVEVFLGRLRGRNWYPVPLWTVDINLTTFWSCQTINSTGSPYDCKGIFLVWKVKSESQDSCGGDRRAYLQLLEFLSGDCLVSKNIKKITLRRFLTYKATRQQQVKNSYPAHPRFYQIQIQNTTPSHINNKTRNTYHIRLNSTANHTNILSLQLPNIWTRLVAVCLALSSSVYCDLSIRL
jgi:hypothetical protein